MLPTTKGVRPRAVVVDNGSWRFVNDVPTGIYTIPEISSIGKNEHELTQAKVPYEVGKAFFKGMARAQISGEPVGMLKILFHRETLEVLGVHCFGDQASEIVHIGQAIMNQPGEANYAQVLRQHHVQLPDHGRSLSGSGIRRPQPAFLSGSGRWPEPAGETDFSDSRGWRWPNRESL